MMTETPRCREEIIKLRHAVEEQNEKMDELIDVLKFRNHLEKRNQLIDSLKVYMTGSERVKTVIERNYHDFIEVCNECYHEILYEAIDDYIKNVKQKNQESDD